MADVGPKTIAITTAIVAVPLAIPRLPTSFFQRVWPPAILVFGLAVTTAWTAFLGYALVSLITELATWIAEG